MLYPVIRVIYERGLGWTRSLHLKMYTPLFRVHILTAPVNSVVGYTFIYG